MADNAHRQIAGRLLSVNVKSVDVKSVKIKSIKINGDFVGASTALIREFGQVWKEAAVADDVCAGIQLAKSPPCRYSASDPDSDLSEFIR